MKYSPLSSLSTIQKEDLLHFTDTEKKQIKSGLDEYKRLIIVNYIPTPEQLELINERLKYLSDSVERLNRFDWKALAASTVVSIGITLTLNTETGKQLFNLFMQALGFIAGHLISGL